ncbi:salicylic acid-binding protein [Trifolium repens]|nr:salicylic acid-binding protein [Trifolium repens]
MSSEKLIDRKHYVLVHGVCHGAWCWYKVKPRLESAGHLVTLMATISPNEKVILVGHSLGGLNIALAMEQFPEKVAVGVFITALAPDVDHNASYVLEKYIESIPADAWLDTKYFQSGSKTAMSFGPKFLSNKLYQLSSIEDRELAKTLLRPGSLFMEDLIQQKNLFSKKGYGSVPSAFIVCNDDLAIPLKFQHWMIQNAGINDVFEIKGADHMAMLCKPQELCDSLNQISVKYA